MAQMTSRSKFEIIADMACCLAEMNGELADHIKKNGQSAKARKANERLQRLVKCCSDLNKVALDVNSLESEIEMFKQIMITWQK